MQPDNILNVIEKEVALLITQKLRSKTTVLARIYHLIVKAQDLGYTHETIHASTKKGGLSLELGSYLTACHRVKKGIETGRIKLTKDLLNTITNQSSTIQAPSKILDAINHNVIAETQSSNETVTTTTASQVADTLKTSVHAGRKDYSKAALAKLKDKGKN